MTEVLVAGCPEKDWWMKPNIGKILEVEEKKVLYRVKVGEDSYWIRGEYVRELTNAEEVA